MASGAAAAPTLQTVVLRVSIHCHGCKKKVRKVLRSVEGVQSVTVDAGQHKVTVTGTVDANTLVQRLHKSGKKGVPWQYCHPSANENEAAPAPAKEALPAPPAQPAGDGGKVDASAAAAAEDKKPEAAVKEPQAESSEKKPELEAGGAEKKPEAESKEEGKVEAKKDGGDSEAAEPAKEEAPAATKDEDEAKKNDKPKDATKAEPVAVTSERSLAAPPPAAPKHAYEEQYRHPYYAPQPVLSYHAAQPSASVSYFAPQPQPAYSMQQPQPQPAYSMQQPQPQAAYSMQHQQPQPMKQWSPSYLYMPYPHAAPEPYYQDYYSPPGKHASPPPMQDSYRIFDDENPNSCSVM